MSIDWITVAAQIANFLVLVWLLKRFLYRPILDGIDAREQQIKTRMEEALQIKEEAAAAETAYHGKVQALEDAEAKMAETVRQKAEAERDALLAEAQSRMEKDHANMQAHLKDEAAKFTARLHGAGAAALLQLMRKALNDLADDTLEARMAHHLARRIAPLGPDLKRAGGKMAEAVVTSHETLPEEAQKAIAAEFNTAFPDVPVRFEIDAGQSPGLVLRMGGGQVAWTVDTYIDGLDALMADQLGAGRHSKAAPREQ